MKAYLTSILQANNKNNIYKVLLLFVPILLDGCLHNIQTECPYPLSITEQRNAGSTKVFGDIILNSSGQRISSNNKASKEEVTPDNTIANAQDTGLSHGVSQSGVSQEKKTIISKDARVWKKLLRVMSEYPISVISETDGIIQTDWYYHNTGKAVTKINVQLLDDDNIVVTAFKRINGVAISDPKLAAEIKAEITLGVKNN